RTARRAQLVLHFAPVEPGNAPAGVVDPRRRGRRDGEELGYADPAPVPGDLALNGVARRSDAEALAKLPHSRDQIAQHAGLRAPPAPGRGLRPRASRTSGSCSAPPGPKRP